MQEEELPFELPKYHKTHTTRNWKKQGLIETEEMIDKIYECYIRSSNCEICGKAFKSSNDRQMDHDHETGKFRNIVCCKCNCYRKDYKVYSNTGYKCISKTKNERYKQGFCFRVRIYRNGKYILESARKTLEEAIELRDKFIQENPNIFT